MFNEGKLLILDGAMGTMLQRNGMKPGEMSEMLNFTRPEVVEGIQRAYLDAGSEVIYANTFGANRRKLAGTGKTPAETIRAGLAIARKAAEGRNARVGLDVGPIGMLLEPMGTLTFEEAYDLFAEMMEAGRDADLIAIETMTDLYEAKAALLAAKEKTNLPVFVTMSFEKNGRTFTGCTVASMARTMEGLGADAVGINCSLGPKELLPLVRELRRNTRLPVIVKPNAGMPDPTDGHYDLKPEDFGRGMAELVKAGAEIIGGCCGTDPDYIRTLTGLKKGTVPEMPRSSFVCTPTVPTEITGIRVIGERINPTGKKRFQQALLENDLDYIVSTAVQQMDAGADLLDVNVGYPGVPEKEMLPRVVKAIQAAVDLPLQLDSADPEALEAALRVYNGKPSINSVNGREESLNTILPLAKRYGAAVVGLTLDEKGIPETADQRFAIAERILNRALALGIPREDVWIDCLTLTVSAQQEQAAQTLKAVRKVREELGLQTLLGVSNISFGLPNRPLMTQSFLVKAIEAGLTLPIVNPNQREIMDAIAACRVLSGEDRQSERYIARFAGWTPAQQTPVKAEPAAAPKAAKAPEAVKTLEEAIIRGLRTEAGRLAREALKTRDEMDLVETSLIPSLDRVGIDYDRGKVFLPQLLSAAQAAQAAFEEIRLIMAEKGTQTASLGQVILATVQGDIHDIGKNIVKTVLENYGYEVLDLGKDVAPETIVEAAREHGIRLVGLSALMTTTLPAMEETVRQLKTLENPPFVMVGGAVVTEDYADKIHADGYAADARGAVAIARKVFLPSKTHAEGITTPMEEESLYIQSAPAYDVEAARQYIPILPRIRELVDGIRDDSTLTTFGIHAPSAETMDRLDREIRRLSADGHQVSLLMADLRTQSGVAYRSTVMMCSQSTIKAIYVGSLIEYRPEALAENGQRMHDAIVFSDNEAYETLREIYGKEPILRWCADAGVDPGFTAMPYPRDRNVRDMFKMWTRLYCFLNHDTTGFAAYYADSLASATRKRLTLPMQTKAGWEHGLGEDRLFDLSEIPERFRDGNPLHDQCATNDTGVVYAEHGPYIFVVYTDYPYAAVEGCPNHLERLVEILYEVDQSLES